MTEKDLKKLNRYQLLEMLIIQTQRANELEKQLEEVQAKLDSRNVQMQDIGSIAEASLQLSGIFEAAQNAAELYLNGVKERAAALEMEYKQRAEAILEQASQLLEEIQAQHG